VYGTTNNHNLIAPYTHTPIHPYTHTHIHPYTPRGRRTSRAVYVYTSAYGCTGVWVHGCMGPRGVRVCRYGCMGEWANDVWVYRSMSALLYVWVFDCVCVCVCGVWCVPAVGVWVFGCVCVWCVCVCGVWCVCVYLQHAPHTAHHTPHTHTSTHLPHLPHPHTHTPTPGSYPNALTDVSAVQTRARGHRRGLGDVGGKAEN